jgi:hypothetical protein
MKLSRRSMLRMAGSSGLAVIAGGALAVSQESPAYAAQSQWRWCWKCQGLWFSGNSSMGTCPASEFGHGNQSSGNYKIQSAAVGGGQGNWRWCWKCQGFWFSGNSSMGTCPASEFGHGNSGSGNYQLRQV